MSSFVRSIQRAAKRQINYNGRGSRLGSFNPMGSEHLARVAREAKRALPH